MNSVPLTFLRWLLGTSIFFSTVGFISFSSWAFSLKKKRDLLRRTSLDRLRTHPMQDELTGVFNRRYFQDTLTSEWKRATRENRSVALLLMDVDCFRKLNVRYGQSAGDECLRRVAQALTEQIRRPGDFVARIGEAEFAVVLPGASADGAYRLAEAMRMAVLDLEILNEDSSVGPFVTLSIGVCSKLPMAESSAAKLLEGADAALYLAKAEGRNRTQLAGGLAPMVVRRDHGVA